MVFSFIFANFWWKSTMNINPLIALIMKNLIFLLLILMSSQAVAQRCGNNWNTGWNGITGNTVRYTWGNNYWNVPNSLYYFNNNTCSYSSVPFSSFPLNSCSDYGRQLYTWNAYGYTRWNTSRTPHWFWAETIIRNVVNTGIIISNTNRVHNPGWYRTY